MFREMNERATFTCLVSISQQKSIGEINLKRECACVYLGRIYSGLGVEGGKKHMPYRIPDFMWTDDCLLRHCVTGNSSRRSGYFQSIPSQ